MEENDTQRRLKVDGMTCNHCASTVSGIIQQEGGKGIHVDYLMGEASFDLGSEERLARIMKRLDGAGYKAEQEAGQAAHTGWSTIEKKFVFTLPFTLVLFSHMFAPHHWWINDARIQLLLCLPPYALGAWHFGKSTYEALRSGTINMDVLILLGSSSAFLYSLYGTLRYGGTAAAHDFLFFETASTIITLVLLGYVIEHRAVQKTTAVLKELFKARPEKAKKLVQKGLNQELEVVPANDLKAGDVILVNTGDRIPADGVLIHGKLTVDESMLTGEAEGVSKVGDATMYSGSLVLDGNGTIRVEQAGAESTIGKIISLVRESRSDKPAVQKLADKISSYFVPAIIGIALLTFLVNLWWVDASFADSLLRSIAVLVIACPCAMGLATPTAVSVGLGLAAKLGIIVKRASAFEEINALQVVVFDKTGTLTTGDLEVIMDTADGISVEEAWKVIKAVESRSNHPIALRFQSLTKDMEAAEVANIEEVKGKGMKGLWGGREIRFGSPSFSGIEHSKADLVLSANGELLATFHIKDRLKEDSKQAVTFLKKHTEQLIILSGDSEEKTRGVAQELGIDHFKWRQLPEQKLSEINLLKQGKMVGMVGDGINDSPSLAQAHVGISMGNANALAAESAKVVILGDRMVLLERLFKISHGVVTAIRQNLFWAFGYNIVAIPLAAAGYLDPMLAAFSMAFSDVVVIGNSLRLRYILPKLSS